jgi:hypothetical protein
MINDLLLDPQVGGRSADFAELLVAGDA